MIEEVKKLANHYFEDIVKIRRAMHQNPELSFKEYNTSLFIHVISSSPFSCLPPGNSHSLFLGPKWFLLKMSTLC